MRYIKSFEDLNIEPLKKYIIWNSSMDGVQLFEIKSRPNDYKSPKSFFEQININHLYNYKDKLEKPKPYHGKVTGLLKNGLREAIKRSLLYQSDSLQDCLDMMPYLAEEWRLKNDTSKYNI